MADYWHQARANDHPKRIHLIHPRSRRIRYQHSIILHQHSCPVGRPAAGHFARVRKRHLRTRNLARTVNMQAMQPKQTSARMKRHDPPYNLHAFFATRQAGTRTLMAEDQMKIWRRARTFPKRPNVKTETRFLPDPRICKQRDQNDV